VSAQENHVKLLVRKDYHTCGDLESVRGLGLTTQYLTPEAISMLA